MTKPMTKSILTDLQKRPLIQSLSSLIPLLKGQISPQMSKTWGPQKGLYTLAERKAPLVWLPEKADPQANRSPATLPNYIALGASTLVLLLSFCNQGE